MSGLELVALVVSMVDVDRVIGWKGERLATGVAILGWN